MKKSKLTLKERATLKGLLDKLRIERASAYDSQGVDCCQHLLIILEGARHVGKC